MELFITMIVNYCVLCTFQFNFASGVIVNMLLLISAYLREGGN
jgi:hypothetical protein